MKRLVIAMAAAAAMIMVADAQGRKSTTRRGAVGADGGAAVAQGKEARVVITRKASLGSACLQSAPTANGSSYLGKVFKKPRQWIVPELEYQTAADWQDELTVSWHILLDSKNAKQRDKPSKDKDPVPQYSYYTVSVRYQNVPKGNHAASCVLPPSVLERYGEPAVISVRITNKEGDVLDLACNCDVVAKSGAWFAYLGEKIGQGRENAKAYLKEHPDVFAEIEGKVRDKLIAKPAGKEEEEEQV